MKTKRTETRKAEPAPAPLPPGPAWSPDLLDLAGLAHALSVSTKQVQRLLSAGRIPAADTNLSLVNSAKGRRWSRAKLLAHLAGNGMAKARL